MLKKQRLFLGSFLVFTNGIGAFYVDFGEKKLRVSSYFWGPNPWGVRFSAIIIGETAHQSLLL